MYVYRRNWSEYHQLKTVKRTRSKLLRKLGGKENAAILVPVINEPRKIAEVSYFLYVKVSATVISVFSSDEI